jgi:hypothetical protein
MKDVMTPTAIVATVVALTGLAGIQTASVAGTTLAKR